MNNDEIIKKYGKTLSESNYKLDFEKLFAKTELNDMLNEAREDEREKENKDFESKLKENIKVAKQKAATEIFADLERNGLVRDGHIEKILIGDKKTENPRYEALKKRYCID
jgi:hypothetical protein